MPVDRYIKPPLACLDLGSAKAVKMLAEGFRCYKYEGVAKPPEALAEQGTYKDSIVLPGALESLKDARLPPLVPEEFAARAATKALTNGKDMEVLLTLQAKVAIAVLGSVRDMSFQELGWGKDEAALLAKALKMCPQLQTLDLTLNRIGAAGAESLAAALPALPALTSLECAAPPHARPPAARDRCGKGVGLP